MGLTRIFPHCIWVLVAVGCGEGDQGLKEAKPSPSWSSSPQYHQFQINSEITRSSKSLTENEGSSLMRILLRSEKVGPPTTWGGDPTPYYFQFRSEDGRTYQAEIERDARRFAVNEQGVVKANPAENQWYTLSRENAGLLAEMVRTLTNEPRR
jgi:hypothetical protein